MATYVAFLRGVNVGRKNSLPMATLKGLCEGAGFKQVRTYIQSGNALFTSVLGEAAVTKKLEKGVLGYMKRDVLVMVRTDKELTSVLKRNPYKKANPSQVGVMLFARPVPKDFVKGMLNVRNEEVKVSSREVYIHYPDGMGRSKLKLPKIASEGTVRNINTITKMVEMLEK